MEAELTMQRKQITLRLPDELWERLKKESREKGDVMASAREIEKDIKAFVGGGSLISRKQLKEYWNCSLATVDRRTQGMEKIYKKFFIPDIAQRMKWKS